MPRRAVPASIALLTILCAAALAACGSGGGGDNSRPEGGSPRADVFVIVLENHSFGQIIGNPEAPFINQLASEGALFTRYYALTHPSLPNYLSILGGSTFGIRSDCTDCQAADPNLAQQLAEAGIRWRAYMGGMPEPCFGDAESGSYVKRHDPFLYFRSITTHEDQCDNVVPGTTLSADIRRGTLPAFAWVTPGLCHAAYTCPLEDADDWLAGLVPKLLKRLDRHGFLVLTFDEGDFTDTSGPGGGRIATIIAGPAARHGAKVFAGVDHYSLLRTLEEAFGLPPLRGARRAPDLSAAFRGGAVPTP